MKKVALLLSLGVALSFANDFEWQRQQMRKQTEIMKKMRQEQEWQMRQQQKQMEEMQRQMQIMQDMQQYGFPQNGY